MDLISEEEATLRSGLTDPIVFLTLNALRDGEPHSRKLLAESFLLCGRSEIASATLPGYAANFASGSYYVLDAGGVADVVNRYLNPYEKEVQAAELYIRNG